MKRVAAEIAEAEPRIDVLINNAAQYSALASSPKMGSKPLLRSITWPISS